jgi:hypothetical protein
LAPFEFWWLAESALDRQVFGNGMTRKEVRELYEEAYGNGDG